MDAARYVTVPPEQWVPANPGNSFGPLSRADLADAQRKPAGSFGPLFAKDQTGPVPFAVQLRLPDYRLVEIVLRAASRTHARKIMRACLDNRVEPEMRRPLDQVLGCGPRDLDDAVIVCVREV